MIVALVPAPEQIRYYAESAFSGFKTLSAEDAAAHAIEDLNALIAYLDAVSAADNSVRVTGVKAINANVLNK
jgi:hypothetical protein